MKEYEYVLSIEGMMCGMCESHINNQIRNNFPIKKVTSSRFKKETVIISKEPLDETKIEDVIHQTGYTYKGMKKAIYEKNGIFSKRVKIG